MNIRFEYDHKKSAANFEKHGITFEEGASVFDDPQAIEIRAKKVDQEDRFAVMGVYGGKVWTVIFTVRGPRKRIISIRRARREEVEFYEKNIA